MPKTTENKYVVAEIVDSALYKLREVKAQTNFSTATIYRMMKMNLFPRPLKFGPKIARWRGSDIRAFING